VESAPPPPLYVLDRDAPPELYRTLPPPPNAVERSSAGTTRRILNPVFHRDCGAGAGSCTSIGYSPSSPTKPGYGFPTSQRYAFRCVTYRT